MSHGAISCGVIGLPRPGSPGPSASAPPAPTASVSEMAQSRRLCVDMLYLTLVAHGPARDRVEMLAREGEHRRRLRGLAAMRDQLGARRLSGSALVPGAALQDRGPAVPA